MHLYTCAGSRGFRVTWTAAELGLDLPMTMLPFPPRARARAYFAVNPLGTVPALVDGDNLLTESSAIAQYLATRFSPRGLAVAPDEADFGPYLDYLHHADATITFPQTVALRFIQFEPQLGLQAAGQAYADWFGRRLIKADARLQDREFLCADRFTVADIAVGYALHLTRMTRLEQYLTPRLTEYLTALRARDGFRRAEAMEREAAAEQGVR